MCGTFFITGSRTSRRIETGTSTTKSSTLKWSLQPDQSNRMTWISTGMSTILLLFFATLSFAPLTTDRSYDPLLAEICGHETQSSRRPEWALNREGSAWGRCQIKYWSAVAFGDFDDQMLKTGVPSRNPGELFDDEVNIETAGNILNGCRELYGTLDSRRLIYCYVAGPNAKPYTSREHRPWSKQIAADFAEKNRRLTFQYGL